MKRILALLLVVLLCGAVLSACDDGGNVTLTVWCAEMDKEMITGMVDAFMATKPGIKGVDVVVVEDDKAREKFEDAPDAAADVICLPHDQLGALVDQKALLEISDSKYLNAIGGNSVPSVAAGRIGGKQYGFPSSFETHMLFYDKSLISDVVAQTLEGIIESAMPEGASPFAMDFGDAYFSSNWFFTYGCRLFGESGRDPAFCDFDSPEGIAAMTNLIDNRERFVSCGGDDAAALFGEHKLGTYIGGPWHAAAMTQALGGNYGCGMLPSIEGKPMQSFAGFKLYCVNANTKNKAVAMDLAAWLTNPVNQKTRFQIRNLIPVATSLADDVDVAVSTTAKAVMAQGPHAIAMPSIPQMSNFWKPTGEFTQACYEGEIEIPDLPEKLKELVAIIIG